VQTLVQRAPVPVTVEAACAGRLPEPVESAAYFVVAEGLANVAKYARATQASVAVRREDDRVTIEVADDGVGGADTANGSGLRGLADRVAALDGTLTLESPAGRGTQLRAEIPVA
jgi:signal transduction histidine kinase